jgi:hypothetical protein
VKTALVVTLLVVAAILSVPTLSFVYESGGSAACARCHEIAPMAAKWLASSHRNVACARCHGDALTLEPAFHMTNANRVVTHWTGKVPERPRLKLKDVFAILERCRTCHPNEYAAWAAGPHAVQYKDIFLDKQHNRDRRLMDDCLRCHAMHFEGGIRDLVTPIDNKGPWKLLREDLAQKPAIPCLTCHSVHKQGEPQKLHVRKAGLSRNEPVFLPSLALFDRRESAPVDAQLLPVPVVYDNQRPIRMSRDPRQGLCYQCHAPLANMQYNSGDDRTPVGVHEGLSCFSCHDKHRQTTRASCATCHPRLSNCNRDVETMDTTFFNKQSRRNIHFVTCAECHPKGIPRVGRIARSAGRSPAGP